MLLTVDGLQVPLTPFVHEEGKSGAVAPSQILVAILNVGVTFAVTVTFTVTGLAQTPGSGVNV